MMNEFCKIFSWYYCQLGFFERFSCIPVYGFLQQSYITEKITGAQKICHKFFTIVIGLICFYLTTYNKIQPIGMISF